MKTSKVSPEPGNSLILKLWPILFVVFIDLLSFSMILPLLPFYAQAHGASAFEVGLLAASFALAQGLTSPLIGKLSDQYGRKSVLIATQILSVVGLGLLIVAPDLTWIFFARALSGVGAGNLTVAQAFAADHSTQENRASAFALIGATFGMGLFLGPALSGLLAGSTFQLPIQVATLLALFSVFATLFFVPDSPLKVTTTAVKSSDIGSFRRILMRPDVKWPFASFIVFSLSFAFFAQGIGLYLERLFAISLSEPSTFGASDLGYLFTYCGSIGVILQGWLIRKIIPKLGEARLAQAAFALDFAGYFLLISVSGTLSLYLVTTLFASGNSFLRPCLMSLMSRSTNSNEQGQLLGLTTTAHSFAQVLAPIIGAALINQGYLKAWPATLALTCLCGLWLVPRKLTQDTQEIHEVAG